MPLLACSAEPMACPRARSFAFQSAHSLRSVSGVMGPGRDVLSWHVSAAQPVQTSWRFEETFQVTKPIVLVSIELLP